MKKPKKTQLLRNLVIFGRLLRRLGIEVTLAQILALVDALEHLEIAQCSARSATSSAAAALPSSSVAGGIRVDAGVAEGLAPGREPRVGVEVGELGPTADLGRDPGEQPAERRAVARQGGLDRELHGASSVGRGRGSAAPRRAAKSSTGPTGTENPGPDRPTAADRSFS